MTKLWKTRLLALAASAVLAGCQHSQNPPVLHGEEFQPDDQPHASQNVLDAQAAAGAAQDATLHPCHFDAHGLNASGRQKLDLMLDAEEPDVPLIVYLDVPQDQPAAVARQSVIDYLKARGLPESQMRLRDGLNPRATHLATDTLTQLQTLQSQGQTGQGGAQPQQYQQGQQTPGSGMPGMPGAAGTGDTK